MNDDNRLWEFIVGESSKNSMSNIKEMMNSFYPWIKRDENGDLILDAEGQPQIDEDWINDNNPEVRK